MIVYLNGRFVPEENAVVSVFDRGFQYGDGLFETVRVLHGRPFRWAQHLQRLQAGCKFLHLKLPIAPSALTEAALELIAQNQLPDSFLRVTVSRGIGPRGYSPKGANHPTVVVALYPGAGMSMGVPLKWHLIVSSIMLPAGDPLARYKTANKLPQILARAEADLSGADEALMTNTVGHIVEGASSNLFWVQGERVFTPPVPEGILPGVTRSVVLELCAALGISCAEGETNSASLKSRDGVFVSLSTAGVVAAASLDGIELSQSDLVDRLAIAYRELLSRETASSV